MAIINSMTAAIALAVGTVVTLVGMGVFLGYGLRPCTDLYGEDICEDSRVTFIAVAAVLLFVGFCIVCVSLGMFYYLYGRDYSASDSESDYDARVPRAPQYPMQVYHYPAPPPPPQPVPVYGQSYPPYPGY